MKKTLATVFLLSIACLVPCSGAVIYQLTGINGASGQPFNESFLAQTPGFVTTNTTIVAADLVSCTAANGENCLQISFFPVSPHDPSSSEIEFFTDGGAPSGLYFFDPVAFLGPGTYTTTFGASSGTLTVRVAGVVPEPTTTSLMLAAGLVLAAARRLRR